MTFSREVIALSARTGARLLQGSLVKVLKDEKFIDILVRNK